MVDDQGAAVEGRNAAQLVLAVPVKVQQDGVRGGNAENMIDFPGFTCGSGWIEHIYALFTTHNGSIVAVFVEQAVAMVFQHANLNGHQLELMVFMEWGEIFRQHGGVAGAGTAPYLLRIALDAAKLQTQSFKILRIL